MNDSLFDKLVEISWRRRLTSAEELELQAWLAGHPEDAERWEADAGLNLALERLKPVVPSSNFTRQVLELVELEQRAAQRAPNWLERLRRRVGAWWPRLTWATAVVLAAGLAVHQYREYQDSSQHQLTSGIEAFSTVAVTAPEVLEGFDAIHEFSQLQPETNPTDEALFALLGRN